MDIKQELIDLVDSNQDVFIKAADRIWEYAEVRFAVQKSADVLIALLQQEGFTIRRGLAGMEHAFVAEYAFRAEARGSSLRTEARREGAPVVGILGEYDALTNMSQECDAAEKRPRAEGAAGHGCHHNLLGVGAAAGAAAIKRLLERGVLPGGTIRYFGCPSEESGYGKAFMAREGVFKGLNAILTWHPLDSTGIWEKSLAVYQSYFRFTGIASHAGAAPEAGRSALDAAELMNVGVNFLREHITDGSRIHYAFIDAGGTSANVVQSTATLYYFVRAAHLREAKDIYDRVVKIAKGAAMMTETEVEVVFDSACADYMPNRELSGAMYKNLIRVTPVDFTREDEDYARRYSKNTAQPIDREVTRPGAAVKGGLGSGSTDVGDASRFAPTAQATVTTAPSGTLPHSWQWVATGKSTLAHKGMFTAAKIIALTAYDVLSKADMLRRATEEHCKNLEANPYTCVIPPEVTPQ
jgi:aminobenzoyl-glutamate utilization protein B